MHAFHILRSCFASISLALLGAITATGTVQAQTLFQQPTSADLSAAAAQQAPTIPQVTRQRLVRLDRNVLTRHLAPAGRDRAGDRATRARALDGVVVLNLFPDVTFTFRRNDVSAQPGGGYVWEGSVPGRDVHEALLLIENGKIAGQVQLDDRLFRIDPVAGDVYRITQLDPSAFPPEGEPLRPQGNLAPQSPRDQSSEEDGAREALKNVTIRVLVAYTVAARNEAGGAAAIRSIAKQGVALANQAYKRAKAGIKLVLAGTMQVTYAEGNNLGKNLNDLTSGAKLAKVRTKRNTVKADLVTLFRKQDPAFCGLAWLPGGGTAPKPNAGSSNTGFSVVTHNCVVGNYSWHHELGHNMGLQHDRFQFRAEGNPNPPKALHNFGYVNFPKRQRTVLAYNTQCSPNFCTRINWFSSGTIKATGKVVIGKRKGLAGAADNSLRLKQNRTAVSKYR